MSSTLEGYLESLYRLLQRKASQETATVRTERREETGASPLPSSERRVIVRSEEKASDGQMAAVQAAIRNGWRLVDIELREATDGEERKLAFILRGPDAPSRGNST
jgi:hypothetical protein